MFVVPPKRFDGEKALFTANWAGAGEQMESDAQVRLSISEAVALVMENRGILREDVQKAIYHAETTAEKFINLLTGRSLASHRPGRVTFWVEYSRVGDEYQIHSAYSHRTEMKRGPGS